MGYPGAIRISKNVGCKHFIFQFTAITVAPPVILMCAPWSYLSIYVLMFLHSCPNAAAHTVTDGGIGSQFKQMFEEVWDSGVYFGNAGESFVEYLSEETHNGGTKAKYYFLRHKIIGSGLFH